MSDAVVIKKFSVKPLRAPLNQPFRTALGQHDRMENALFGLELKDGTKGYGEAGIATHITGETVADTFRYLQDIGGALIGRNAGEYLRIAAELHELLPRNKASVAAVMSALMDVLTRHWKIPLWKFFGNRCQKLVTDITIVLADLPETEAAVRKFHGQGFRTFKIKIGRDEDLDLQRIVLVNKLAPRATIYLDANQAFTSDGMLRFLKKIKRFGVRPALLEQPVPREDWDGLKKVSRLAGVPVCADESVRTFAEAVRAIHEKVAPVINIKLMKTGIFHSREIALWARNRGVKLMIGGMMESSLAMTTAAHFAAGLGGFDYVDLDTPFFIRKGFDRNPFLSSDGVYDLRKVSCGVGIVPKIAA